MTDQQNKATAAEKKRKRWSIGSIFKHSDGVDMWLMTLGFIGAVADGFSAPVVLIVSSRLMNTIGSAPNLDSQTLRRNVNENAVALLYLACGTWVACFLEAYCWTRTGERQATRMRAKYLQAVLRQDVGYFDLHITSTSEVVTSVSNDSLLIQDVLGEKVPNFLMNFAMFIGSYIIAFLLLWRLALVGLPFMVFLIIPGLIYGRTLIRLARKTRQEYNKAGSIAEQAISSIRTVYAFVEEHKTLVDFSAALQGSVNMGLRLGLAKGFAIGSNGIVFAIWSFLAYYGSRMVMYHGAQGGTVYVVGGGITFGGLALGSCLSDLKYFAEACSAAERITEMINRVPEIDSENKEGKILDNICGEVEFRRVRFAYPSRPETMIFQDFSLIVPAGKTVALVGGSGSGKSTVISLLQRFYDPLSGDVLVDGYPIKKLQLKWLRSQMGLVSQEPILFATTIKENILFGKEDAETEQVIYAAKSSNAHNFISLLPQGYDTQVGEGGIQMSGGQKQRIAIARAIIKMPQILLLDEATSALDSESERVVQEALEKASVGRTTIVIAHRLSTIRNVDLIAVVQDGQLVEMGSHDDLMQNDDGNYSSLIRLQQTHNPKTGEVHNFIAQPQQTTSYSVSHVVDIDNISHSNASYRRSSSGNLEAPCSQPPLDAYKKEQHKYPAPSFRRLLVMNLPEWKQASIGCLSAVMFGAVQPVYAFSMGSMVSVLFLRDHDEIKEKTRVYALCFLGLAVFSFLINISQHCSFAYMGEHLTKRIREMMLSKMLTFEVGWFDQEQNSSGAICSRLANDANVVKSLVGDRMALIVQTSSAVIVAFTMGLVIAWKLALVMIAVQPTIILCNYTRNVLLKSMSKKAAKAQSESSKLASEAVCNFRTITSFSSQDRILQLLEKAHECPRQESIRQSWIAGIVLAMSKSIITCNWALDYWYGGLLVSKGEISAKELYETFMILLGTGRVVAEAGSMTTDIARGAHTVISVFSILDRPTQIDTNDPKGHELEKLTGRVEFCDVDFAYPTRLNAFVLQDFSINIEEGKSTALVGESGSGKSTVVSLIERFYDPMKGTVKIDSRDVRSYNIRSLRRHIALVSQEPILFHGTIRENIVYGARGEISEAEIKKATTIANAHDFISAMKDGYDTLCGNKGMQLSGGQKQRIAIARAILKKPSILLLDEATSALDSLSEKVVQESLERVMIGRTNIVVAHRLSTIQNCDLIVVLNKGRVTETGTHSSLLAKGPTGAYHSLVHLQRRSL